jgi:hypothetical protein
MLFTPVQQPISTLARTWLIYASSNTIMLISGKQQSGQLSNGHLENHMVHASEVLDCILLLGVFDPFCTMDTFGHLVKS